MLKDGNYALNDEFLQSKDKAIRNGNGYGRANLIYGISGLLSLSSSVFRKNEQGEVRVRREIKKA